MSASQPALELGSPRALPAPVRQLVAWTAYPVAIAGAVTIHLGLVHFGVLQQLASYLAVALGALALMALERSFAHRSAWRPERSEVVTDLLYGAVVQVALPVLLAVTAGSAVLGLLDRAAVRPSAWWPHDWPVAAQVVLMVLAADFLRYWLHVAAHRYAPLWRLHAVHHAPQRLYWLNVSRFHPAEKALQYGLDALPFLVLGVGADVLALYFTFYALNGFFQHCNVELRLGWLNWVISGPELHRWHHDAAAERSHHNYGNNLIVWDVLFGTRFLPATDGRVLGAIGLPNRRYPTGFGAQLKTPLVSGIETQPIALPTWRQLAVNAALRVRMTWIRLTAWRRLVAAARQPRETQAALLQRILGANRETRFGVEHAFGAIESVEAFRRAVPVQDYESLRPYIDEHERTGTAQLTAEAPVLYAQTSGTTGDAKYVPVLESALRQHAHSQAVFSYVQHAAVAGAYDGHLLGIVSPAEEGRLASGTPFGSASGHVYRSMPALARSKYVVPYEVFEVADYELKYRLILRLAVVEENITAMGSANPSTFLKLQSVLEEQRLALLRDVEQGAFDGWNELSARVRDAVAPRLACRRERLAELRRVLRGTSPTLGELWPRLKLLTTWTGGSCGIALASVRALLPAATRVAELGYLSSEFRGTITVDVDAQAGLPTLSENFFEFVDRDAWDAGDAGRDDAPFRALDELEPGGEYYVIVTTASGLYRYFMNDIVRVTGRFQGTPTLAFVQKGRGATNITGEKLYESQAIGAVRAGTRAVGVRAPFYIVLADVQEARYRVVIEVPGVDAAQLARAFDAALADANLEYAQKRASGRLNEPDVVVVREGTGEAYKRYCIENGQREGQFKTIALQYEADFPFSYWYFVADRGFESALAGASGR